MAIPRVAKKCFDLNLSYYVEGIMFFLDLILYRYSYPKLGEILYFSNFILLIKLYTPFIVPGIKPRLKKKFRI